MKWLTLVAIACLFGPGCSPLCTAARTAVTEPLEYCTQRQEHLAWKRSRELADSVWSYLQQGYPGQRFSPHYVSGFKAGFADFVRLGGTGAAPPIPPRRYWKGRYQTEQGRTAVHEWYAGFRDGAAEARDGCYRQWQTVPSSLITPCIAFDNG